MIAQMDLVVGILKLMDELQPGGHLKQHVGEAVCKAATQIANAANEPARPATDAMGMNAWLASHDTGLSSKYLAGAVSGAFKSSFAYPRDPDDFGRCYRMMRAIPEVRVLAMRMDALPAPWPQLHKVWLELERLYEEEFPTGRAPKLMACMNEIFKLASVR